MSYRRINLVGRNRREGDGYLRDPQLQRNVHLSQNRIESYHQLRAAIAQVGGKKELTGQTDIDIEISVSVQPPHLAPRRITPTKFLAAEARRYGYKARKEVSQGYP